MKTKRISYYVWWATAEENENGRHHRSLAFSSEAQARHFANEKWKEADFVSIDKVQEEYYPIFGWQQIEGTETERIELE